MTVRILPREAEMEAAIRDAVRLRGGLYWHVRDSRGQDVEGMPDSVIVLPPTLYLIETKSQARPVTPGQAFALDLLGLCDRLEVGIVRPRPRPGERSYSDFMRLLGAE